MGITGKLWRNLYNSYRDFWCRVRLGGSYSKWYLMKCGIHQGGYLSLLKYFAFIDPLLRKLETSDLCCSVAGIKSSPIGYADDLSACAISKTKIDRVLNTVYDHSCIWRYTYNADKSTIMVYKEDKREHKLGSKYRTFMLGSEKVKEKAEYDQYCGRKKLFVWECHA